MVTVSTVKRLIAEGWLSPVKYLAPPSRLDTASIRITGGEFEPEAAAAAMRAARLVGDVVQHYREHVRGPAIGFCCTLSHSRELAAEFVAAGYRACHVDGETPVTERAAAVAGLADGSIDAIFNVNLFGEGLDLPAIAGVMLLRPTKSLAFYLQMVGRALRSSPGKRQALVLDHANNVFVHGLPTDDFAWTLADREQRKPKAAAALKRCPECAAIVAASATACPHCGGDLRRPEVQPLEVVEGELEVVDAQQLLRRRLAAMPLFRAREWAAGDYHRLRLIADIRGYKAGWAWHEQRRGMEAGR
jgi:superfamily II DNA or RNA helicase